MKDINDIFGLVLEEEIVEEKPKTIGLFDYLNSINYNKTNLIVDEVTEKQYVPYLVNRGLSFNADTVVFANEMNSRPHLDKKLQYQFLINIIRPKKRYSKWIKNQKIENIDTVKEYYGFSSEKARQAVSLLSNEQIDHIKQKLQKGG